MVCNHCYCMLWIDFKRKVAVGGYANTFAAYLPCNFAANSKGLGCFKPYFLGKNSAIGKEILVRLPNIVVYLFIRWLFYFTYQLVLISSNNGKA